MEQEKKCQGNCQDDSDQDKSGEPCCGHCEEQSQESIYIKKIDDLTNTIKYVQADYENYRKRIDRDKQDFKIQSTRDVIESILPVLDTFELAIKAIKKDESVMGFEMVYAQFITTLESSGLRPIEAQGQYDPKLHEALLQEASDKPKGTILEELQKGYILGDKVIRHTKVKISA